MMAPIAPPTAARKTALRAVLLLRRPGRLLSAAVTADAASLTTPLSCFVETDAQAVHASNAHTHQTVDGRSFSMVNIGFGVAQEQHFWMLCVC